MADHMLVVQGIKLLKKVAVIIFYACIFVTVIDVIGEKIFEIMEIFHRMPWGFILFMTLLTSAIKIYIYLYWNKRDLFILTVRGPQGFLGYIVFKYLKIERKICKFLTDTRFILLPSQDEWRDVEEGFLRRAPCQQPMIRDDLFYRYLKKWYKRKCNRMKNIWKKKTPPRETLTQTYFEIAENIERMRSALGPNKIVKKRANKRISSKKKGRRSKTKMQKFSALLKIKWEWFTGFVKYCYLLPVTTFYHSTVFKLFKLFFLPLDCMSWVKIFISEIFPLAVNIIVVWNGTILFLYFFNEDIIKILEPYPDLGTFLVIISIPALCSMLLHDKWRKEDLRRIRNWEPWTLQECLISYYLPLDNKVYSIFITFNELLPRCVRFKID